MRFNYFGEVAAEWFTPGFKQTWSGEWLTDVSIRYNFSDDLSLTLGGMNVFDEYPDEWECQDPSNPSACRAFPFPGLGFKYGWETTPFGINGGYYFARMGFRFDH